MLHKLRLRQLPAALDASYMLICRVLEAAVGRSHQHTMHAIDCTAIM
jgi:hypothetical protein